MNLEKHILPVFKDKRLDQIKPLHIIDFLKRLGEPGVRKDGGTLASGTQMNHRVLKNVLTRAVEWKVIKDNPVASAQKPKVISKRNTPYNKEEVTEMFQALLNEPLH